MKESEKDKLKEELKNKLFDALHDYIDLVAEDAIISHEEVYHGDE